MYAVVLFRKDLRLDDNPALTQAGLSGLPVIPLFVFEPGFKVSNASGWGLVQAVKSFSPLCVRCGDAFQEISTISDEFPVSAVYMNKRYVPAEQEQDRFLISKLKAIGIKVFVSNGSLLFEPDNVLTQQGKNYQRFTPYYHKTFEFSVSRPAAAVKPAWAESLPQSVPVPAVPSWAEKFGKYWDISEKSALERLALFEADKYQETRDYPAFSCSRLASYIHFGKISVRRIWHTADVAAFQRQLVWREFNYHLLWFNKNLADKQIKSSKSFGWFPDNKVFQRWKRGETGKEIVDAGMKELWETGYMHNRVRMIAASYLIHHLKQPWQEGEKWFMQTLIDADEANNPANWQWTAGCGANGSLFHPFNPDVQLKKYDAQKKYVSLWENIKVI